MRVIKANLLLCQVCCKSKLNFVCIDFTECDLVHDAETVNDK